MALLTPSLVLLPSSFLPQKFYKSPLIFQRSQSRFPAVIMAISSQENNAPQNPTKLVTFLGKGGSGKTTSAVFAAQIRTFYVIGTWQKILALTHTIKSHGATVARSHKHDWLILLLLVVIEIVLNIIHPFYRFVGKDMMSDLRYPMKDNTVPIWAVPMYAVVLPIIVFNLFYIRRRSVYDLHHSILGLLFAVLITGVLTDSIKDAVGRPRPDFFWLCFPDGKDEYDTWGNVICHGKDNEIREGHKSFPSGHTSWSFAGLAFLSLYLAGKIKAFDRRGHVAKLCIVFLPLLAASLVGVSRVDDYWHHWQDVFAGGLLGLVVATFCYLQFFPPPYHTEGWGPYAHFHALEESRTNSQQTPPPINGFNMMQAMQFQSANQQAVRNNNEFMAVPLGHDTSITLDDMESGRM